MGVYAVGIFSASRPRISIGRARDPHPPRTVVVRLAKGALLREVSVRHFGTSRLPTQQRFGMTKFSPRGVLDLHAEKF